MVTANSWSSRPECAHEQYREEHAARDKVIEIIVKPISRRAFQSRAESRLTFLHVADNIFSMTMASSTTNPTQSVSAINERLVQTITQQNTSQQGAMMTAVKARLGMTVAETIPQEQKDHQHDETKTVSSNVKLDVMH